MFLNLRNPPKITSDSPKNSIFGIHCRNSDSRAGPLFQFSLRSRSLASARCFIKGNHRKIPPTPPQKKNLEAFKFKKMQILGAGLSGRGLRLPGLPDGDAPPRTRAGGPRRPWAAPAYQRRSKQFWKHFVSEIANSRGNPLESRPWREELEIACSLI